MKKVDIVANIKGRADGEKYNYLAKCFPMNEYRVKWLKDSCLFIKEVIMYKEIIHQLNAKIEDPLRKISVPNAYYADSDEGVLIMENLKLLDFSFHLV